MRYNRLCVPETHYAIHFRVAQSKATLTEFSSVFLIPFSFPKAKFYENLNWIRKFLGIRQE